MSKDNPQVKIMGPWRSLHAIIWLVGLYILITRGWIFPGILVLIAISALYEGMLQRFVPQAFEEHAPAPLSPPSSSTTTNPPAGQFTAPIAEHRIELLPQVCPSCNAPIRGHEVRWTGPQSANCPYCGTNLPMNKV